MIQSKMRNFTFSVIYDVELQTTCFIYLHYVASCTSLYIPTATLFSIPRFSSLPLSSSRHNYPATEQDIEICNQQVVSLLKPTLLKLPSFAIHRLRKRRSSRSQRMCLKYVHASSICYTNRKNIGCFCPECFQWTRLAFKLFDRGLSRIPSFRIL